MNIVSIIPARMGSSRFPGKPLALINNIPMIEYVYNNVKKNTNINKVWVATPDKEIFDHMISIKGNVIMTSNSHTRASDRCCEALKIIEKQTNRNIDIMVMVQGDEPMINSRMIDQAIKPMLLDKNVYVTNLIGKIKNYEDLLNKNTIKVVCDKNSFALYFSRSPIPDNIPKFPFYGKQVCVIPFQKNFLLEYSSMKETPLEISESIDMLRILESGKKVYMAKTNYDNQSVDTLDDLNLVNSLIKND